MKDSNRNLIVQIIVSGKRTSNVSLLQQTIGLKLLSFWIFLLFTFVWNKLWSFLSTFEEMLPWTAALDHPNYFRLGCILLNYTRNLPAAVFKVFFSRATLQWKRQVVCFLLLEWTSPINWIIKLLKLTTLQLESLIAKEHYWMDTCRAIYIWYLIEKEFRLKHSLLVEEF